MSRTGRSIGFVLILTALRVSSEAQDPISLLQNLIGHGQYKPLVVYIEPVVKNAYFIDQLISDQNQELDDLLLEDDLYDGQTLEENAKEQAKYLLYNFLRTSPDNREPERSDLEDTKQVLRQALRARCEKVMKCVTKCTIDVYACPSNCQKVFDKMNLCEPPKPPQCKKSRCGKTMPPKWLL